MIDDPSIGVYGPGDAARLLGVPPSTLRAYASLFGAVLSTDARGSAPGQSIRHRRYSLADLEMLGRVKALLATGLTYDAVRAQLAGRRLALTELRRSQDSASGPATTPTRLAPEGESVARTGADAPDERPEATGDGQVRRALDDLVDQLDAIARALADQGEAIARFEARLGDLEARLERWEVAGRPSSATPEQRRSE